MIIFSIQKKRYCNKKPSAVTILLLILSVFFLVACQEEENTRSDSTGQNNNDDDDTIITTNNPPTISGTPAASVTAGSAYSFAPSAADSDGDSLSFVITNKPAWASFNASNGTLTGTPSTSNAGMTSAISIGVDDGSVTTFLDQFSIMVAISTPSNTAPTISGTPATTVTAGSTYTFTPVADDADSDPLLFSINTLPAWATFDTGTGQLSGTPAPGDAGASFSNIVISVTDNIITSPVPLLSFNILVEAVVTSTGTATLSWTPPTENTDGSALTNLAGYKVYYGKSAGNYTTELTIDNPGLAEYVVTDLPGNTTYHFVITAYDSVGNESAYSLPASKRIN